LVLHESCWPAPTVAHVHDAVDADERFQRCLIRRL